MNNQRILPLDAWRFIAVNLVIFFHLSYFSDLKPFLERHISLVISEKLGIYGVLIFFSISGFVITRTLIIQLKSNNLNLFKFYIKRALRIIPPLIFYIISLLLFDFFKIINFDKITILYS